MKVQPKIPADKARASGRFDRVRHDAPEVSRSEPDDGIAWSRLDWEDQVWDISDDAHVSRRRRSRSGIYQSAVPPAISRLSVSIPPGLLSDLDDATAAIVRFDAETKFKAGGMTAVLLRSESSSSSKIEQITASARAVAEAELTGSGSRNAALVAANVHAMEKAISGTGPITPREIESIQETLLRGLPHLAGFRRDPVWIGAGGSTPLDADFVPPAAARIPELIEDLTDFMARDDLPILAQTAVAHAQFETIHPFADGNGRTGRALIHRMLRQKELATEATIPISSGMLLDTKTYFDALNSYRNGNAGPIVSVFADASIYAAESGRHLRERISEIRKSWLEKVSARSDSAVWKIIDHLASHPVGDAASIGSAIKVRSDNVPRQMRKLEKLGIVVSTWNHKAGRTLYRAPEILTSIDNYASTFGRRS